MTDSPDDGENDCEEDGENPFMRTCPDCGHEFDRRDVGHTIYGPGEALFLCPAPDCRNAVLGVTPQELPDEDEDETEDDDDK